VQKRSSWLTTAAGVVAGCVFGVSVAALLLPRLVARQPRAVAAEPAVEEHQLETAEREANGTNALRVAALERRLFELEERGPGAGSDERRNPPERSPADPAAERQAFDALLAAHAVQPSGSPWSRAAGARFDADLAKLAGEQAFSVGRVDCRGTSCAADVSWASAAEADRGWRALITADYGVNCTRQVLLREQPDSAGRQHADLLFECAGTDGARFAAAAN
jgi:hypothetical protein